ncbi:MAG TPA: tRNA uridine-5-carboxymethylaminomethyl(34) synthesis GTPase MnmE, partial [Gammaproteobacteria bacterium]|nr:tRNA uridine-5-carboxymethylaminomethyl(34) synthesis GTPase MnmE [Gammaproteobacteria bacterium]
MALRRDDTIAALATAPGVGAIAVIRLSGSVASNIARELTGRDPRPRIADLRTFHDGSGAALDRGLVLFFPGPSSFTGEDVVELHCHGGRVVADAVLAAAYRSGARPAEPGEFTLRAFLNDKIDLVQAEAIADLVASGSAQAARAAMRSLEGEFSSAVAELQHALTTLRVRIEAWLDFPDEELPFDAAPECAAELDTLVAKLDALRTRARSGRALRDGLSVAIAGPPNAGKSSLLNRLAGYDAAIVTEIPGTTRDPLREHLSLDGLPVTVVDTAGLRDTNDPVEREGVRRARLEVARADRLLWVADVREPLGATLAAAGAAQGGNGEVTIVANKIDLVDLQPQLRVEKGTTIVELSALTGAGIDLLVAHLKQAAGVVGEPSGAFSARRRHVDALERTRAELGAARAFLGDALEITAEHLRNAQMALSELTGELSSDDLLGEIFATFC